MFVSFDAENASSHFGVRSRSRLALRGNPVRLFALVADLKTPGPSWRPNRRGLRADAVVPNLFAWERRDGSGCFCNAWRGDPPGTRLPGWAAAASPHPPLQLHVARPREGTE
jgi:hypothetical protein